MRRRGNAGYHSSEGKIEAMSKTRILMIALTLFLVSLLFAEAKHGGHDFYGNLTRAINRGPNSAGAPANILSLSPARKAAALKRLQPTRPYIVIDRYANKLFLRTEDSVLLETVCSTGSGAVLVDTVDGQRWEFDTPAGVFHVTSKLSDPWWRKPDWAYIEDDIPIPKDERERYDPEMMGEYAIGFGDGFFIHGTIYERLLGISVTHGCVRVNTHDLRILYDHVHIGTPIYIY
jgi:L,D-transpeptidase ErfK/SrfK